MTKSEDLANSDSFSTIFIFRISCTFDTIFKMFQVKYLGVLEVKDSRGVAHCEEAVKRHKQRKERNKTRALLCISPETIRLVKVNLTHFLKFISKV